MGLPWNSIYWITLMLIDWISKKMKDKMISHLFLNRIEYLYHFVQSTNKMASAVSAATPERESAPSGAALYGMDSTNRFLWIDGVSFGTPDFTDFIAWNDDGFWIKYSQLAKYIQGIIPSCVVKGNTLCDNDWIDFIGYQIDPMGHMGHLPEQPTLHDLYIQLGLRMRKSETDWINYIPENLSTALAKFIVSLFDATGHNSRRFITVSKTIQFVNGPKTIPVKVYTSEEMDLIRNIIYAIFNRVDLIPKSELFVDEDGAGAGAGETA